MPLSNAFFCRSPHFEVRTRCSDAKLSGEKRGSLDDPDNFFDRNSYFEDGWTLRRRDQGIPAIGHDLSQTQGLLIEVPRLRSMHIKFLNEPPQRIIGF